jgi:large subunit ribosomal protein L2
MPLKKFKPTSPGHRFMSGSTFEEITTDSPFKKLTSSKKRKGGRNHFGRLTAPRRGGGHKKRYRLVDFKRDKFGVPATVATIEYDPNRSARIALLHYGDGEKRYIVAPEGLKVGDRIVSSKQADIRPGNSLPLADIPLGTLIHNVELKSGCGAQLCRSAGTMAQLMAKEGKYAHVRLPSGEVRMIHAKCRAVIGQVSNPDHTHMRIGKAGRHRWLGKRPRVRGVAMNPVDHPMGGGEGRSSGGRHPCSPKGMPAKGFRTRRKRPNQRFIVKKRGKK